MNYKIRIRDLREDRDLKQKDIAEVIGTSQTYYSQYETGKRPLPIHVIRKLAVYYNVSADYIIGLIDRPRPLYRKDGERIKNSQQISHSHHFTITNK